MPGWRRVSDWKQTITLVELDALPLPGLLTPEAQLRARFPRLAAWVAEAGLARVEPDLAARLRAAGATLYEIGYHRGSDALLVAEIHGVERNVRELDVNTLALPELDALADEARDAVASDRVDALLRILTEGRVTERAVILAWHAPPLSASAEPLDDAALSAIEALDPGALPDVGEAFVDRVARALAVARPPPVGPSLRPAERRAYVGKASLLGVVAVVVALVGSAWTPLVAVLALPVAVLCAVVVAIHLVALRQGV